MNAAINKDGRLAIHTDNYDICFNCKNIYKCPLMQAISKEIVILHYSDVEIKECGLYRK